MVYISSVSNQSDVSWRGSDKPKYKKSTWLNTNEKKIKQKEEAVLLYKEKNDHPIHTALAIEAQKLKKALFTYPVKGFEGSKNSNFYEFLTMGTVPYLAGSATLMALFNVANRFYDLPSKLSANKMGKKMALGVAFYGIFKSASKSLIETPLNMKYDIDVNLPYRKKIVELPEESNTKNLVKANDKYSQNKKKVKKDPLVTYEYHTALESVDFPRFDLYYNSKDFGKDRNAYFYKVGKNRGLDDSDLEYSDQKVKSFIKEKVTQCKFFSSLSSFLWAATGVALAAQDSFDKVEFNPITRYKHLEDGRKTKWFPVELGKAVVDGFKELVGADKAGVMEFVSAKFKNSEMDIARKPLAKHVAGRVLAGSAILSTLIGNFFTLTDFNKDRGRNPNSSDSILDNNKEKVVC